MSTSDSDYSIDWLGSDEDDYDSPKTLSPEPEGAAPPPSSSSSSSLRESPRSRLPSGPTHRRTGADRCYRGGIDPPPGPRTSAVSPVQGFTCVCEQLTSSVGSKHHPSRKREHCAGVDAPCEKPQADTENELFSHKCMELQCYIPPLSSILRGLRSGRYSERLSSFQESVAMDRIQRIMGVLQNPNMGGRFLSIILKIEEMLQSWFPHIKPDPTDDSTPAKKQKMHPCGASPPPSSLVSQCSSEDEPIRSSSSLSTRLRWFHMSPICSLKTLESTPAPPPSCSQELTQDNAVSSSTDSHSGLTQRHASNSHVTALPLPFKIRSPCLERLLQAKESIITPRTVGNRGGPSWLS
ncbi:circadian-associated transcriptional repressor-like [Sphaeramia orbicularis]|uniref:circadian-associated transcriptional repressor-like n=1 Tax=Sphaeramia orbicularis TaxID=375764 RepID=UPI00117DCAB6|nr:circadian-associated transcriptional repressor-like [Sphaeramia orbicularis]